jgi:hypothetical protein
VPGTASIYRRPTQLVVVLLTGTIALVLAFCTVLLLHEYVVSMSRLRTLVNINGEANLPAWWNSALLLMIAIGALVAREFETERRSRLAWLTVAACGLALSLDEIASLHERLGKPVRDIGIVVPTFAWLVPGIVVATAMFVVLVAIGRALPQRVRRGLLLALVCYLGGAIGVEAINGTLRAPDRLVYYWIGTTIEETIEMVSCVLAIGVIARLIAERLDNVVRSDGTRTLEVVGHGLPGGRDGPDPDPGAIRRILESGRPQGQVPVRR